MNAQSGNSSYGSGFSGRDHPHHPHHPYNGPPNNPLRGSGFRPMGGSGGGFMPHAGEKRRFQSTGRGDSDNIDAGGFVKLFVGAVPRTATEEDIRPLFEEHGKVIEVALIKDRRTSQQHGWCFIKYATSEEADRAIRALHNQYTLPGGVGPIQVRYADGERERLAAHKVFVLSLNREATEKEVEEIFSAYGHVEDVYIMRDEKRQSRGCGFVKFSHRDMATAAINGLNGIYVMRGCTQPFIVRYADPKKPRAGDSRSGPTFRGPGFGPQSQGPLGVRPGPSHGEPMGGHIPPNAYQPMSPQDVGPPSQTGSHGLWRPLVSMGGVMAMPSAMAGSWGTFGGPGNGSLPDPSVLPPSTSLQSFNPPLSQVQSFGQKLSPLQKPLQSLHRLPPSFQPHSQQTSVQTSLASVQPLGQPQAIYSSGQTSFNQALPSQQLFGSSCQLSLSQPLVQHSISSAAAHQMPSKMQTQAVSAAANQQLLSAPTVQQQMLSKIQMQSVSAAANQQMPSAPAVQQQMIQPQQEASTQSAAANQQMPSAPAVQQQMIQPQQGASTQSAAANQQMPSAPTLQQQMIQPQLGASTHSAQMSSQQTQVLQMSFQSPPAFSQLQQPFHMMQPSSQNLTQQQASQAAKQQPSWTGIMPQLAVSTQAAAPLTCNWTEHTSPEGYKYYYNRETCVSRWDKPEELTLFEKQQQKQKWQHTSSVQKIHSQPQAQSHPQVLSVQQVAKTPQMQLQTQLPRQPQLQQPSLSSSCQAPVMTGQQNVQEFQASQDWMRKNMHAGT